MDFKTLLNTISNEACVVSIQKESEGYGEIRIVEGNDRYINSFKQEYYINHEFIPNSIYTEYLQKNLNFEEYCYRSAIKKELLQSYAYPEHFKSWMHMLFIPLEYETKDLAYCLYIMEINENFSAELLSNSSAEIDHKILRTTLQLANTTDFRASLADVTTEIRKICNASFCCILLANNLYGKSEILAWDRDPNSDRLTINEYKDQLLELVDTWEQTIEVNDCLIVNDDKGMNFIKNKNIDWYNSLQQYKIRSIALFRLKARDNFLGYMWVSNFKVDDTPHIKSVLEITSYILGFEIGNHLLVNQLTRLSAIDALTGLYNRNKMDLVMQDIIDNENSNVAVIFLDINGLKRTNDVEGHLAGDKLLKKAAKVLKKVFVDDYVFRPGGDEFVVILTDTTEETIKKYIEKMVVQSKKYDVSFAVGFSITENPKEIERILKEADYNMYNDKRRYYTDLNNKE